MNICETRKKILLAAKKEFANSGYSGARMSSIAKLAEVNQALLHYHYKTKENLYVQVFEKFIGEERSSIVIEAGKEIENWFAAPDVELYANLYISLQSRLILIDDELHELISKGIIAKNPGIKQIASNYFMPHMNNIKRIIEKGKAEGIFEIIIPEILVLNIFTFPSDVLEAEFIITDGEWKEKIYSNKEEKIFNYIVEMTFKSLRPAERELPVPELSTEQMNFLNKTLETIKQESLKCD